jgi:hypothetical protein
MRADLRELGAHRGELALDVGRRGFGEEQHPWSP